MDYLLKHTNSKKISVTSILLIIIAILFSLTLSGCGADYGEKLNCLGENELYYTSNVTKAEAEALGDYLSKEGFFKSDGKISVQLNKEASTYQFRMVIKTGLENDDETIALMKVVCTELSENVFNNKEVEVHLCDAKLKTLRTVVNLQ